MKDYRYTLIHNNGQQTEVTARNGGRKRKFSRTNDGYYTETLDGNIVLTGGDYDLLKQYEQNNPKLYMRIDEWTGNGWTLYYYGYFFIWDCEIDQDKCQISVKLTTDSLLTDVLQKWDKKLNVINYLRENKTVHVNFTGTSLYETVTETTGITIQPNQLRAFVVSNLMKKQSPFIIDLNMNNLFPNKFRNWRQTYQVINPITWVVDPLQTTDYYNLNSVGCIVTTVKIREIQYIVTSLDGTHQQPSAEWDLLQTITFEGATLKKYARYVPNTFSPNAAPFVFRKFDEPESIVNQTQFKDDGIFYLQVIEGAIQVIQETVTYENKFGSLYGVLNYLYKQASGETQPFAVKSDYLFALNNVNPLTNGLNEYSQLISQSGLFKTRALLLCQKSDFKNPLATEPSTVAETSLKEMITLLCDMFNMNWFINSSNQLQLEHVVYFNNNLSYSSLNTSQTNDIRNEVGVKVNNKYTFEIDKITNSFKLRYAEAKGIEFTGIDVRFNVTLNNKELVTDERVISNFTADLDYVNKNLNQIQNSGFIIVVAESGFNQPSDESTVVNDFGTLTNVITTNGLLSVTKLYDYSYKTGLPFVSAVVNGQAVTDSNYLRNKLQAGCKIARCLGSNINPYTVYRTGLGNGTVKDMEHSQDEKQLALNLIL